MAWCTNATLFRWNPWTSAVQKAIANSPQSQPPLCLALVVLCLALGGNVMVASFSTSICVSGETTVQSESHRSTPQLPTPSDPHLCEESAKHFQIIPVCSSEKLIRWREAQTAAQNSS